MIFSYHQVVLKNPNLQHGQGKIQLSMLIEDQPFANDIARPWEVGSDCNVVSGLGILTAPDAVREAWNHTFQN